MNITYTGKSKEFTPAEQQKLDARFARLGKLCERKGEKKAHVVITSTRHLQKAEIQIRFEEHPLVGIASDPDLFQAVCAAVDKLEKQTLKLSEKLRDARRKIGSNGKVVAPLAAVVAEASGRTSRSAKVYRVLPHGTKPMTLEEAVLEISRADGYYAYRDAKSGNLSVLVRREDGHFDLVEG